MRWGLLAALAASGCVESSSVTCGDVICPEGTTCSYLTGLQNDDNPRRCVPSDAITACAGIAPLQPCSYGDVTTGACYMTTTGEVCLPSGCGNALVDDNEVCDDGNSEVGDGCSQACRSNETCGNGIVDPSTLEHGLLVPDEQCDDGNLLGHDACNQCELEQPAWASAGAEPVVGRVLVPITFDSVRHRFVVFGGLVRGGSGIFISPIIVLGDTWESDGVSWVQLHPTVSPSIRRGTAIAYDAATRRTILFGGSDGVVRNDTWEWDGTRWTVKTPMTSPTPRTFHSLAYDSKRKVVVLYGGNDIDNQPLSDTWEWNGTTWRHVATATSPPPQISAALAFDPVRGVMVMAGSYTDTTTQTAVYGTWEYDGTNWTPKLMTGAPQVQGTMLAWDAIGKHVITFAATGASATPTTLAWDGSKWIDLAQVQGGDVRIPSLASDPSTGRVISFGGLKLAGTSYSSSTETWTWNGASWTKQTPVFPEPRGRAAAVLDSKRRSIVLIGGTDQDAGVSPVLFRDTWQLDGLTWTKTANQPWSQARWGAAAVYDTKRDEIVVFGGNDDSMSYGDTWIRKDGTWTQNTTTPAPSERYGAAMAFDEERRQAILFGGNASGTIDGQTWAWNGATWTQLSPAHSPPAREGAALAWDPVHRELVLFGGLGNVNYLADTWTWNGTDWTEHVLASFPAPRGNAGFAWDATRGKLVLVGGINTGSRLADTWEWDGTAWTVVVAASPPAARSGAAVLSDPQGAGIVMVGGELPGNSIYGRSVWDHWRLRWDAEQNYEECNLRIDVDLDMRPGCEDPDCWARCSPLRPPNTPLDPDAPSCGDGVCNTAVEDCRICPADCTCTAACGDTSCDTGETQASCPGDCTP